MQSPVVSKVNAAEEGRGDLILNGLASASPVIGCAKPYRAGSCEAGQYYKQT